MRINNPKSFFVGSESTEYNLVNEARLTDLVSLSGEYITNLLKGNNALGAFGYAWLDSNGKLAASCIPDITVSETTVLTTTEVFPDGSNIPSGDLRDSNTDASRELFYSFLSTKLYGLEKHGDGRTDKVYHFEKGDIIVVIPEELEAPNANVHGTYIVVEDNRNLTSFNVAADGSNCFQIRRLSYAGNEIIRINGKSLDKTTNAGAGNLSLALRDVLTQRFYLCPISSQKEIDGMLSIEDPRYYSSMNERQAAMLENSLFRVGTASADTPSPFNGKIFERFQFKSYVSDGETISQTPEDILYATCDELHAVDLKLKDNDNVISAAVNLLNEKVDSNFNTLSGADFYLSGQINNVNDKLGSKVTAAADFANDIGLRLSGTVYQRIEGLTKNQNTIMDILNSYYAAIESLSGMIHNLAGNAILLKYVGITLNPKVNIPPHAPEEDDIVEEFTEWKLSNGTIVTTRGEDGPETDAKALKKTLIYHAENREMVSTDVPNVFGVWSERILAIYDPNGEQVMADVKIHKRTMSGNEVIVGNDITLVFDVSTGEGEDAYIYALTHEWTLLKAVEIKPTNENIIYGQAGAAYFKSKPVKHVKISGGSVYNKLEAMIDYPGHAPYNEMLTGFGYDD